MEPFWILIMEGLHELNIYWNPQTNTQNGGGKVIFLYDNFLNYIER